MSKYRHDENSGSRQQSGANVAIAGREKKGEANRKATARPPFSGPGLASSVSFHGRWNGGLHDAARRRMQGREPEFLWFVEGM